MNIKINIDNYEEIMFRLMEDDFDQTTRADLIHQIESDELFKFEWESWQKSTWDDPIENYILESEIIAARIIRQTQTKTIALKRRWYYAAASALLLAGIFGTYLFLPDFTSGDKQLANIKTDIHQLNKPESISAISTQPNNRQKNTKRKYSSSNTPFMASHSVVDTILKPLQTEPVEEQIVEKQEVFDLPKVETFNSGNEKTHYMVIVNTSDIPVYEDAPIYSTTPKKVNLKKILTNPRMLLCRKANGKPDKIYIVGEDDNFLCINLNFK